jgi:hypothetical protein
MVFFIQGSDQEIQDGVASDKIAKTMINIETGKEYYNESYEYIENPTKAVNLYSTNNVEFNIIPKYGNIIIYTNLNANFNNHTRILNTIKSQAESLFTKDIDYVLEHSNPYTMITNIQKLNRILYDGSHKSRVTYGSNAFQWVINIQYSDNITSKNTAYFNDLTSECKQSGIMLIRTLSTIIYDAIGLFNITIPKQLDYPHKTQYSLYQKGLLMLDTIHVHTIFGLEFELYELFTGNQIKSCYYTKKLYDSIIETPFITDTKTSNSFKLRRPHPNKKWYVDIKDTYQYIEQEEQEKKRKERGSIEYRNDICYISRIPLSSLAIVLHVKKPELLNASSQNNHDNHDNDESFDIIVSPATYYGMDNKNNANTYFNAYFTKMCGLHIISATLIKYPRSTLDVINMLPKTVNSRKKDVMLAIEKYGYTIVSINTMSNITGLILDVEKNEAYIGIQSINDTVMRNYLYSKYTLCHIVIIYK